MVKGYVIFGIAICLLMAYANSVGWAVGDSTAPATRGSAVRGVYHK